MRSSSAAANDAPAPSGHVEPAYEGEDGVLAGAGVWMVVLVLSLSSPYFFEGTTILVFGALVGLSGLALWIWIRSRATALQGRRRAQHMRQAADSLGMVYHNTAPSVLLQSLVPLPFCQKGKQHAADNYLEGTFQGVNVSLFDFHYVTHGGETTTYWRKTLVRLPNAVALAHFSLQPERLDMKLAHWFGWPDIDFTGSETRDRFSRQYQLSGADEAAVRAQFHDGLIAWLAERPGWTVACQAGALFIWRDAAPPAYKAHFRLTSISETPPPAARYINVQDIPLLLNRAVDLYHQLMPGDDSFRSAPMHPMHSE